MIRRMDVLARLCCGGTRGRRGKGNIFRLILQIVRREKRPIAAALGLSEVALGNQGRV